MTIIAGFKSHEGVVVCADTQETIGQISKRNIPKLRFEPSSSHSAVNEMAVAFCGAANNGPFIDKIVDRAWEAVQGTTSLDEACQEIEESIKNVYKEFGRIYQRGYCPEAELVYGVKMHDASKLFYALGPIVNEKFGYASGGVGYYMADFLSSRMYRDYLPLRQCMILSAYVLFQAKEHVEGCGGDSEIAVLRNEGTSGRLDWRHTKTLTNLVKASDHDLGSILLHYADLDLSDEDFKKAVERELNGLVVLREHERNQLKEWRALWRGLSGGSSFPVDDMGLPNR